MVERVSPEEVQEKLQPGELGVSLSTSFFFPQEWGTKGVD